MTVYVSKLRERSRFLLGRTSVPPPLFVLTADTEDELHAFAGSLGLRRDPGTAAGSQQEPLTRRYTLTESEHDRAVELGAQVITTREADQMEQQRAAGQGESQP